MVTNEVEKIAEEWINDLSVLLSEKEIFNLCAQVRQGLRRIQPFYNNDEYQGICVYQIETLLDGTKQLYISHIVGNVDKFIVSLYDYFRAFCFENNIKSCRASCQRPGLIRLLESIGFKVNETIMVCEVPE